MLRRDSLAYKVTQLPWFLLLTIVVIAGVGTLSLFSAASEHDVTTGDTVLDPTLAISHATRFLIMFALMFVGALLPLGVWAALAWPVYAVGVLLLLGVEIAGDITKGAQRWLDIGPVRLQPSELMKIAVPLALARYYHQLFAADRRGFIYHLWALMLVLIPVVFILRQPDLGTALMVLGTGCAVIFFAGISLRVVATVLVLLAVATPLVFFFGLHDYQRTRVETLFNPDADPLGAGYQVQQGMMAIGAGGPAGTGFLAGQQKELGYIPEQHTDFIFTIIAEEFGFAGSMAIMLVFAVCLYQGLSIAGRSRSAFGALAASGFVATMLLYVVINVGMVIGLLPVVGIPLPLISYGGTVIVTVMAGFALLMAVHLNRTNDMTLRGVV